MHKRVNDTLWDIVRNEVSEAVDWFDVQCVLEEHLIKGVAAQIEGDLKELIIEEMKLQSDVWLQCFNKALADCRKAAEKNPSVYYNNILLEEVEKSPIVVALVKEKIMADDHERRKILYEIKSSPKWQMRAREEFLYEEAVAVLLNNKRFLSYVVGVLADSSVVQQYVMDDVKSRLFNLKVPEPLKIDQNLIDEIVDRIVPILVDTPPD